MKTRLILVFVILSLFLLPGCSLAAQFQVDTGGTLTNNLQAYYKLEDTSDYWSTHTFTNYGSTSFGTGKVNNAADLGASNTSKYLVNTDGLGIGGRGCLARYMGECHYCARNERFPIHVQ